MEDWEKKAREQYKCYLATVNKILYGSLFIVVASLLILQLLYNIIVEG